MRWTKEPPLLKWIVGGGISAVARLFVSFQCCYVVQNHRFKNTQNKKKRKFKTTEKNYIENSFFMMFFLRNTPTLHYLSPPKLIPQHVCEIFQIPFFLLHWPDFVPCSDLLLLKVDLC